ncbi:MAG: poly(3-hydroxybutyrate) depolymerase [Saprospiraceae bacterium]
MKNNHAIKLFTWTLLLFVYNPSAFTQIIDDSLRIENNYRSFHYLPPQNANASLIFILHGSGGTGMGIRKGAAKLEAIAPAENILLVYPDGYKNYWNECRKSATSLANIEDVNEQAFFKGMISYFNDKFKINERKVFAIGTSGGGHMAYKLAVTIPESFKAIAALIANLPDDPNMDCVEKKIAIPVMIVNGTTDPVNPYNGGEVTVGGNVKLGTVRSTDLTFKYWSDLAGYKGKPKYKLLPDSDPKDGKRVEQYSFHKKHKPEVTLLKVIGGKHDYPNDINVYLTAWEFFKRQ